MARISAIAVANRPLTATVEHVAQAACAAVAGAEHAMVVLGAPERPEAWASTDPAVAGPDDLAARRDDGAVHLALVVDDSTIGTATWWPTQASPIDRDMADEAAALAAVTLANAAAYWRVRLELEQIAASLPARAVIEQAKGIIMANLRCTADEAFASLVEQSQHQNIKVRRVAQDIVEDVSRHS